MPPVTFLSIPDETAKVAHAVLSSENFYLHVGDQLSELFYGLSLEELCPQINLTGSQLGLHYLVLVFQVIETLSDRSAAEALRRRVDWKYALHLPMEYQGPDGETLCAFRRSLLEDESCLHILNVLASRLSPLVDAEEKQAHLLDPNTIVEQVCRFNRLDLVRYAIHQLLKVLATQNSARLRLVILPHWYDRYSNSQKSRVLPTDGREQEKLAVAIGLDGYKLMEAIGTAGNPGLAELPEFQALKEVWQTQYEWDAGKLRWTAGTCAGCAKVAQPD